MPAVSGPAGSSQVAPRRSDQCPKNGCTIEFATVAQSTIAPTCEVREVEARREVRQQRRQRALREIGAEVPERQGRDRRGEAAWTRGNGLGCHADVP